MLKRLLISGGLLLSLLWLVPAQAVTVIKSESDERDYRYLRLPNQLQVLLISDPSADKAAAALDVYVGSLQNPPERPGLAHFLEHMLFLGTRKYPDPGEYQAFIGQHGGSHNAYTSAENTNYFFDIDVDYLEPALDRFSQFFIAPLFDEDYVNRERNAVHSEYTAGINHDGRRIMDVYRELFNPLHPASGFSVGSLTTLADREDSNIRDELISFYERYYSADIMRLVVLGRESLDDLEKLVMPRFRQVPRREVKLPESYPSLFPEDFLPAEVSIQPEKEIRELTLLFPVPDDARHYDLKPLYYIGYLLGDEGQGSLLSLLKDLGWAEGLSAGTGFSSRHDGLFRVSITLTELGVRAKDQIVALVFYKIGRLEARGLKEWRYREMQQLADIDFRFLEKRSPMRTVSALASRMQTYAPEDILRGDYLLRGYNERLIKEYLSYLRSDRVLVSLVAPEATTTQASRYYRTPYGVGSIGSQQPDIKLSVRKRLSFAAPNDFIPQRITVKVAPLLPTPEGSSDPDTTAIQPQLIVDNERTRAWFRQDQEFRVPKSHVNLRLQLPQVTNSVEGAAQAQLFAALVMDDLNEFAYPASLAGLNFSVRANMRGLDISLSGYSSRQGLLLTRIAESVRRGRFSQERFNNVKAELIRQWRNEERNAPYMVLAWQIPVLNFDPYWSNQQMIDALAPITLPQFHQFSNRLLQDGQLEGLFYGNLFRQEAVRLAAFAEHQLLGQRTGRTQPPARAFKLADKEKPWLYQHKLEHPDNAALLYVQGLGNTPADSAHMSLLQQILQPAFFNDLRTEQQLGYIVTVFNMPLRDLPGNVLVVQSPEADETRLIAEVERFLEEYREHISESLTQNRAALARQLREPPQSMDEQAGRYWESILLRDTGFVRRERLADAVAAVTPESLENYYRAVFLRENRRLWLTSDKLEPGNRFQRLTDLEAYQKPLETLVYP